MFPDNIKQRVRKVVHLTTKLNQAKNKISHHMLLLFPAISLVFQLRVRAHIRSFISRYVNMFTICAMCVRECYRAHARAQCMCVRKKYVSLFPFICVINYNNLYVFKARIWIFYNMYIRTFINKNYSLNSHSDGESFSINVF